MVSPTKGQAMLQLTGKTAGKGPPQHLQMSAPTGWLVITWKAWPSLCPLTLSTGVNCALHLGRAGDVITPGRWWLHQGEEQDQALGLLVLEERSCSACHCSHSHSWDENYSSLGSPGTRAWLLLSQVCEGNMLSAQSSICVAIPCLRSLTRWLLPRWGHS